MLRHLSLLAALLLVAVVPALARPTLHHRHHHGARHTAAVKAPAAQGVKVWVNTNSGVYHFPGERWYGSTKEGQYMSEAAAKAAGYRATENGQ